MTTTSQMRTVVPAADAAPSLTHVVLVSLPPELLSRLLGFVPECWYTAHYRAAGTPIPPDATHSDAFVVLLPAAATVCTAGCVECSCYEHEAEVAATG